MIDVIWACRRDDVQARGYWDQTMLTDLFDRKLWTPAGGRRFQHMDSFDAHNPSEGAVVITPGRMEPDADWINEHIEPWPWVLVVVTSDEEARFPWQQFRHPNMKVWVQTPDGGTPDGTLPVGYTPGTIEQAAKHASVDRAWDWFFAGQITHPRRHQMVEAFKDVPRGAILGTEMFADGIDHDEFMAELCDTKIAPCPGGPVCPDTFRLWEALQAGCVPLVDLEAGERDRGDYWNHLLGDDAALEFVTDWEWETDTLMATNLD